MNLLLFLSILCIDSILGFTDDQIQSLPGLAKQFSFRQYSGYLNGGQDIRLHYWFAESQSNPSKDPVILWLSGGPGASSVLGMITENGPFGLTSDGHNLTVRPTSWNTFANVLYLSTPFGVGYSYTTNASKHLLNDDSTALMNRLALEDFFAKFPHFESNPFYITGESYAGIYIPTLAVEIYRSKSKINVKGIAIGNGETDSDNNINAQIELAYAHGFIDSKTWDQLSRDCCTCEGVSKVAKCNFTTSKCNGTDVLWKAGISNEGDINPYNIYYECPLDIIPRPPKPGCPQDVTHIYMNLPEVRKALHIPVHVDKWLPVNMQVNNDYDIQYSNTKTLIKELIEKHNVKNIILYDGDLDMVCNFLGNSRFVEDLGFEAKDTYKLWRSGQRVAGFVKRYDGITHVTVRDAGHMVIQDQPLAAIRIIEELIGKSKLN